jgi:hypothetical protein
MQIFQCVSGSPYRHWQPMPAVARGSVARASLSNLYLCPTYMREWYSWERMTPVRTEAGRGRHATDGRSGVGWRHDEGHSARTASARKTENDEEGTKETR